MSTANTTLTAIHARLSDDPYVRQALGTPVRIFDRPGPNAIYPFVRFGELRIEDRSADDVRIESVTLNIHLYSRYAGRAEAMAIVATLLEALERDRLRGVLPGCQSVVSRYADSFAARDGHSRHSVLRLTITVAEDASPAVAVAA